MTRSIYDLTPKLLQSLQRRFSEALAACTDPDVCWEWPRARHERGYGLIGAGKHRTLRTHRVAMEIATGERIASGLKVLHSCDNPPCCNPAHLSLGTDADNTADKLGRGRQSRGAVHRTNTKLTMDDARAIRAAPDTARDLASRYGIHLTLVHKIRAGTRWAE